MFVQTIKSIDGKLMVHGTLTWRNGDEFGFIPQGKGVSGEWWCKLDFWKLIEGEIPVFKVTISEDSETAA